jgi:hypothetical protein
MSQAFNKFQIFVQDVGRKIHNLNSDVLKICLTNVAPVNTNTTFSNLTEIAAGNGYSSGGTAVTGSGYSQSSGTASLTGSNVVFTASGGTIGPFRYAVIYNSTAGSANLIGWWDYASAVTLNSGDTFTVDISGGILTLV